MRFYGVLVITVFIQFICKADVLKWEPVFSNGPQISKIVFVNSATGYAIARDTILSTIDSGKNWTKHKLPDSLGLYDIAAISKDTLKALGYRGTPTRLLSFLSSYDKGQSWKADSLPYYDCKKIIFTSAQNGWVIGTSKLLHTINGGVSWDTQSVPDIRIRLCSGFFLDSLHGWAGGFSSWMIHTSDGGKTWVTQHVGSLTDGISSSDEYFIDSLHGWVACSNGIIEHTNDGGTTWEIQMNLHSTWSFCDLTFFDSLNGLAVGSNRKIFATKDGGTNWVEQICPLPIDVITSAASTSKDTYVAVGDAGAILRTTNGGNTWDYNLFALSTIIYGMSFIDSLHGWIVSGTSGMGITLRTDNGGKKWYEATLADNSIMSGICFLNDSIGWMCGYQGAIQHTVNGGKSWTIQLPKTGSYADNLYSIHFVDESNGWAVGNFGCIYHTSNGGTNWMLQQSGTTTYLRKVHFINKSLGFIANDSNFVLQTNDGGQTWVHNYLLPHANDLFFIDSQHAWLTSSNKIYRSVDAGTTWQVDSINFKINGFAAFNCGNITFKNLKTGIVATGTRFYALSSDSGKTWRVDSLSDSIAKYGFVFSDSNTLWGYSSYQIFRATGQLSVKVNDGYAWRPGAPANIINSLHVPIHLELYDIKGRLIADRFITDSPSPAIINQLLHNKSRQLALVKIDGQVIMNQNRCMRKFLYTH